LAVLVFHPRPSAEFIGTANPLVVVLVMLGVDVHAVSIETVLGNEY